MGDKNRIIKPEDYAEPRCLLGEETYGSAPSAIMVPQQRIVEKMDEYMSRRDYDGAQRHLLYWLEEALLGKDKGGELMIRNELVGHYRKVGKKEAAMEHGEKALVLLKELGLENSTSGGTTYVNLGTACNAFSENERAMELFEKAREVYEGNGNTGKQLLGGLYNNMALTCVSLKRYDEAFVYYDKAINAMSHVHAGELEIAITYLNMANAYELRDGLEASEGKINELLDKASELLSDDHGAQEGYYAFVLEKCAPTFSYYGYFADAEDMERKAKMIYERS